jgi:choline-sulfatase
MTATAAGVTGAMFAPTGEVQRATRRPLNILFMMDDQHRGDLLGVETDWIETPNLNRLCREGVRFNKAYASVPSCIPARVSILTGMSPWGSGLISYAPMADEYPREFPRTLTGAGYRTHVVGKTHYQGPSHGFQTMRLEEAWRGQTNENFQCDYRKWFAEHHPDKDVDATGLGYTDHRGGRAWPYDEELHPTNWTAREAVDFLDTYDGDAPWLLKVSFKRPHPPFDPPQRLMDHYEAMDLPKPQVGDWAYRVYGEMTGSLEESPNAPRGNFPEDEVHRSRAAYYAVLTHVDEQIGTVLEALERRGELENTLIVFTADHGDMMGDNHLWRKCYAYEGSARIPMIIRWPESMADEANLDRGDLSSRLIELRDVAPTCLDAANIPIPDGMEGASMLDIVRGEDDDWRDVLDLEHGQIYFKENAWVALTDGRYKYIHFTRTGDQQLFDLDSDPHELHNLASDATHGAQLTRWRKRMYDHLAVRGEPWVRDGDLATFEKVMKYGPNHPKMA